jgi:hypothetical protein
MARAAGPGFFSLGGIVEAPPGLCQAVNPLDRPARTSTCCAPFPPPPPSVWHVLLASYESMRRFGPELAGSCDLLVCDEGHRWVGGEGG